MFKRKIERKNNEMTHSELLFFVSPTSIVCRKLEKFIIKIMKQKQLTIVLIKIDVTKTPEIAEEFNISVCPTMIFHDCKVSGNFDLEDLEELISSCFL